MLAREAPEMAFTSLSHSIDIEWLQEAYRLTRKNGAPGIDGQTTEEYAARLEENLQSLLNRAKSGTYRAPPVRRTHIPKGSGSLCRAGFEPAGVLREVSSCLYLIESSSPRLRLAHTQ
jgi:hypothetical protein